MSAAQVILSCYAQLIDCSHPSFNKDEDEFKVPVFSKQMLLDLFSEAINFLNTIPTLVNVEGPSVAVGDLHGNIRDLLRIIRKNGLPEKFTYVFLGDYVDRGEFSVEVLTLLLALQVCYQERVVLLRGNHELKINGASYGFAEEVQNCYGDLILYEKAHELFQYLSLAAIIDKSYFCVHGGISERIMKLENISNLKKPVYLDNLNSTERNMIDDMLWSDPCDAHTDFTPSLRGHGHCYGTFAMCRFFHATGITKIIRGHTMVQKGVAFQTGEFVITVFSSGYYHPSLQNRPGFLTIEGHKLVPHSMHPLPQFTRKTTHFTRPVSCTTLSGLQSGRPIGPGSVNRYWSSRRPPIPLPTSAPVERPIITPSVSRQLPVPVLAGSQAIGMRHASSLIKGTINRKSQIQKSTMYGASWQRRSAIERVI